jgi:hypothetical protein
VLPIGNWIIVFIFFMEGVSVFLVAVLKGIAYYHGEIAVIEDELVQNFK